MVFWARLAEAQLSVVIVVPHVNITEYEGFEHRLRSELIAEGFQPASVEVSGEVTPQTLQKHATRLMSPAAISISILDQVVTGLVWIRARGNGTDLLRSLPEYPLGEQAPSFFAVRATDVLHGGLLELGYIGTTPEASTSSSPLPAFSAAADVKTSKLPPAPEKASAPQQNAALKSRTRRPFAKPKREKPSKTWFFRGMASVEVPFLGYPLNSGFNPSVLRRVHPQLRFGLVGSLFLPVIGKTAQGHATVTQTYLGARIEYLQLLSKQLTLHEFLETGAHAVFVTSDTVAPYRAHYAQSFTGFSSLGLGATWAINGTVGLMAETGLLLPWKRADVLIVRTVVAEASGPAMLFNAGIELAF
jgi:hypothetical protein